MTPKQTPAPDQRIKDAAEDLDRKADALEDKADVEDQPDRADEGVGPTTGVVP